MQSRIVREDAEVIDHAGPDQHPEDGEKLALGEQVGLAGFPDHVGDAGHGGVHLQGLGLGVLHQAEDGADGAHQNAEVHQVDAAHPAETVKMNVGEVGDLDVSLAGEGGSDECSQCSGQSGHSFPGVNFYHRG